MSAKKATAKKATAKKATAKKATAKKATAKKATPRGARRSASQPRTTPSPRAASSSGSFTKKVSRGSTPAEPGDSIVIDSHQVGSTARTGEVVEVIRGEAGVSYWVRWADGHQSLIAPKGGSARIVRASDRA